MKDSTRKVLLLIDNATSHGHVKELSNVKIQYLVPNTTSKLQPLDAGIIAAFKVRYRSLFIKELVRKIDESHNNINVPRGKIDLITAVRFVAKSWDEISSETIKNCWNHTQIIRMDNINKCLRIPYDNEIDSMISSLKIDNPMTFAEYIMVDNDDVQEEKNDEKNDNGNTDDTVTNDDDTEDTKEDSTISSKTALDCCNILVKYFEHQTVDCIEKIKSLRNIKCFIENRKQQGLKQMSMMDFVNK